MIIEFPPHESASPQGLIAVGGDLEPESLLLAYRNGIFPWPIYGEDSITWFSPPQRAVLFLEDIKISRTLKKRKAKSFFSFKINTAFESVVRHCAYSNNRKDQEGTWITDDIIKGYTELHKKGFAHSFECYKENQLVGGLYGVSIGKMFAGESMFYLESDASKLTFLFLVERLKANKCIWIDCQQLTPLFESFGAKLIERKEFLNLLKNALNSPNMAFI